MAEQELRRKAQGSQIEGLGHLLMERTHERAAKLDASLAMLRLYREGLLVQSEGAFKASLAQYETGKAPFTAVLESLNGWIADQSGLLQTQAQVQAIAIAQEELTLGPTLPIGATGLSAGSMGAGAARRLPRAPDKTGNAAPACRRQRFLPHDLHVTQVQTMNDRSALYLFSLLGLVALGLVVGAGTGQPGARRRRPPHAPAQKQLYRCPMHPEVVQDQRRELPHLRHAAGARDPSCEGRGPESTLPACGSGRIRGDCCGAGVRPEARKVRGRS